MNKRKLWSYGYTELAELLNTTEDNVRQMMCRGDFHPAFLKSVCLYFAGRLLLEMANSKNLPENTETPLDGNVDSPTISA